MSQHEFGAEISRLLKLMIHSIYTNKEIFLRELISNASDACDKMKFHLLDNGGAEAEELRIEVELDPEANTIVVRDNGIGMTAEDMKKSLGVIASSGTQKFIEEMKSAGSKNIDQIGQFGVGFYSAFMVADKVEVISRRFDAKDGEKASIWSSSGENSFEITETDSDIKRGSEVKLYVKPEETQFVDKHRLKHIISSYSDHIQFSITLKDKEGYSEVVNKGGALWIRPKSEISTHEYNEFYRSISHAPGDPWATLHNIVEGNISYTSLLFIPGNKPYDLFHPDRRSRVKLYIKRVFITDQGIDIVPSYMRFLRGVVDSNDLPLNLSRETLQHNSIIRKIKKSIVKKVLLEIKKKAEKDYEGFCEFWNNFGEVLKEGLCESALEEKEELMDVCRFKTSKSDKLITLNEYIDGMVDSQKEIFYITGDSLENLKKNPQLEGFNKRNIEVLLLDQHVDDFWVQVINQYKNKELKRVTQADIDLDKIKHIQDAAAPGGEEAVKYFKEILGTSVSEVRVTNKLVDSPVCLSIASGAMSSRMEKMLIDQKQLNKRLAKVLEINPEHQLVKDIISGKGTKASEDLVHILFAEACMIEEEPLADPRDIVNRMNRLFIDSLKK